MLFAQTRSYFGAKVCNFFLMTVIIKNKHITNQYAGDTDFMGDCDELFAVKDIQFYTVGKKLHMASYVCPYFIEFILRNINSSIVKHQSEEPPALMKGKGIPITGAKPMVIAMLMTK